MALEQIKSSELDSQVVRQLETGEPDLKFTPMLEKDFREFCLSQVVTRGRLAASVAFVLALAITCISVIFSGPYEDSVSLLEQAPAVGPFALLSALLSVIVLASFVRQLKDHYEVIGSVAMTLTGVCGIYAAQLAAVSGASYMLATTVLMVLYACRFLGFRFQVGAAMAVFFVIVHIAMGLLVELPLRELVYTTAILAASAVIGTVSSYNWEKTLRMTFIEQRMLNELAQRDGLTGLYNRRIFDDYIKRVWRQAKRDKVTVEVIFIDIDHFKVYNDLYGHQAGDDCLRRVANRLAQAAKRPFDFSARYGGEEFVLVLYGPPQDYARALPEQLRQEIMELAIRHEGSRVAPTITVSVGVALAEPSSGRSLTGAIQAADEALYQAKQNGRNRVVFKDASESEVETGNFRAVYGHTS